MTSKERDQLLEWAQVIYDNSGEEENFNISLYNVVMEMRDAAKPHVKKNMMGRVTEQTKILRG